LAAAREQSFDISCKHYSGGIVLRKHYNNVIIADWSLVGAIQETEGATYLLRDSL
jgi:hypothetical protein